MTIARVAAVLLLLAPAVAEAAPQDEEKKKIEELEKQVAELNRRVKVLEDLIGALKAARAPAATEPVPAALAANEASAMLSLRTLATAEADFRANDRDSNGLHDFWAGDVSGLYRYTVNTKEIKLIEKAVADADAAPLKTPALSALKVPKPVPKAGYLFTVLAKYVEKEKTEAYHTGNSRNTSKFGFAATPAEYGKSGRHTFMIGESNTVWKKDLGGKAPDVFPENPLKDDWERID